jgi:hypothetical protein
MARPNRAGPERPASLVGAFFCSLINGAGGFIFSAAWPDVDERATTVIVSLVMATLMIGTAWWLLSGARWGAIGVAAVNAFNVLLGVPAYFAGVEAAIIVGATISIALSVLTIWLVFTPAARQFWGRRPSGVAAA